MKDQNIKVLLSIALFLLGIGLWNEFGAKPGSKQNPHKKCIGEGWQTCQIEVLKEKPAQFGRNDVVISLKGEQKKVFGLRRVGPGKYTALIQKDGEDVLNLQIIKKQQEQPNRTTCARIIQDMAYKKGVDGLGMSFEVDKNLEGYVEGKTVVIEYNSYYKVTSIRRPKTEVNECNIRGE